MDAFAGTFTYEFPNAEGVLATLFEELGKNSAQHGIQDWGVSQTTYVPPPLPPQHQQRGGAGPFLSH